MTRDPRQGAKKKRTPRQAWQAAERAEKRAIAQTVREREEREAFAAGGREDAIRSKPLPLPEPLYRPRPVRVAIRRGDH